MIIDWGKKYWSIHIPIVVDKRAIIRNRRYRLKFSQKNNSRYITYNQPVRQAKYETPN